MSTNLNDRATATRRDTFGMLALTEAFPVHCRQALEIECDVSHLQLPSSIVLTGMGGSAATGDFAKAIFDQEGTIPFQVNRNYVLPHFVGSSHLVLCCSYSGDTEETLSAYADAKSRGSQVVAVTSGGMLSNLAEADGHCVIRIPRGYPPRTALGYLLIPVLQVAEKLGLIPEQNYSATFQRLNQTARQWTVERSDACAKQLAKSLFNRPIFIYGLGTWQGTVARRWKNQISENAKLMAFSNSFPELSHNEILGWVGAASQGIQKPGIVILRDGTETDSLQTHLRVMKQLIGDSADVYEVTAEGDSLLEKLLSLTLYGDFVSLYLAALGGVDPGNIDSIDRLKSELAKKGPSPSVD